MKRRKLIINGMSLTLGCAMFPQVTPSSDDSFGVYYDQKSVHPLFDFGYWEKVLANITPDVDCECDVETLIGLVSLRKKLKLDEQFSTQKNPVDLFLWMKAEAKSRWLTRYGGVPYRSRTKEWPQKNGKKATFLGQLCFRDSLDIFPNKLPGDLLRIFVFGHAHDAHPDDKNSPLLAEWDSIDSIVDPLSEGDTIHSDFEVPILTGVRFRTNDYLFAQKDRNRLAEKFVLYRNRYYSLISLPATKIGKCYFEVQDGFDPREWIKKDIGVQNQLVGCFYSAGSAGCVPLDEHLEFKKVAIGSDAWNRKKSKVFYMGDPGHLVLFDVKRPNGVAYYISG